MDAPRLEGTIPAALRGTLLRNGPGRFESGMDRLHFLDGHALVAGLCFEDGRARFRSRFVRTPELVAEEAAGRILHRRVFTNIPSRWANVFKLPKGDNGNHDVYVHGGRVVASNDKGHHVVDPRTLETRGPEAFGGLHRGERLIGPMPRVDPESGRLVGWVVEPGGAKPDRITFFEADEAFRVVSEAAPHTLASPAAVVHDQAFTARWYVATQAAARLRFGQALWGGRTLFDCFAWPPAGTADLVLVSRPDGARSARVPIPGGILAAFHLLNARDDGARVIVDLIGYAGVPDFGQFGSGVGALGRRGTTPPPRLLRLVVDPEQARVVEHVALSGEAGELPEVRPDRFGRPYRYVWLAAPAAGRDAPDPNAFPWFGALLKVDVETGAATRWEAGTSAFVSQPVFAPRGDEEDDGWVLSWVEDAARGTTEVVVLDARDLAAGPVARIDLGVHLPGSSHVTWAPGHSL